MKDICLGYCKVKVVRENITESDSQAIVSAADIVLSMAGGVAGQILRFFGEKARASLLKFIPLQLSRAVSVSLGKNRWLIHAVTTDEQGNTDYLIIRKAVQNIFKEAKKRKITSLTMPALGCGRGNLSARIVAKIMAQEIMRFIGNERIKRLRNICIAVKTKKMEQIFDRFLIGYLEHFQNKGLLGPFVTVDAIIYYQGKIVLVKRTNPPLGWALPGGFVDAGETVEQAVIREVKEETNLDYYNIEQFKVYSQVNRDIRFHTISVVFIGKGRGNIKSGSDAGQAKLFNLSSLPDCIAFDHKRIIKDFISNKLNNKYN